MAWSKNMAQLIKVERKSDPLTRPTLACLSRYHTLNLTAGCPYECRYCYARSFRSNPGAGNVHFYVNTLELLKKKLPNKRKKLEMVYLSTACEPFSPLQEVLEALYGVTKLLLEHGVSLLISTKSDPPDAFLDLFSHYKEHVHIQVGLTTANDEIRSFLEPYAASVESRLQALQRCLERGLNAEVRCDPLIPQLTDTPDSFEKLCQHISQSGVSEAAGSYLFLRRGNFQSMNMSYGDWSFRGMVRDIYTSKIANYCGNSEIRIASSNYRKRSFNALREIATSYGVALRFCRCKNPDITTECCHPLPSKINTPQKQATLFE